MKKMLLGGVLLLSATALVACSNSSDEETTTTSIEIIEESSSSKEETSHNLSFDESYTFTKADMHVTGLESTGLKMTIKAPVIDENAYVEAGYSDIAEFEEDYSDFKDKKVLVVTIEVENTSSDYIDLGGWTVLDSEGKAIDFSVITGVSSPSSIDGLTAGQKATIVDVYPVSDSNPVTISYENATWK
ncbi:hypothetical protein [Streptococcus gallolyticus]|uniref:hypothetical protein n=1 Tax=Streptococcus gallolyticus TaxID=315405 RepID=UPI000E3FE978|nr:hypothetical protein [Streptococcus gallolyticus]RGC38166.1 hypothetical protein DXD73_08450 [Streptococcus gallolyticus]